MPAVRRSGRSRRGAGWHKKGYRENGSMWVNVRRATHIGPFVRGHEVNESSTMEEFLDGVVRDVCMEDGFPIPDTWFLDVQRRGKSLWAEPMDAAVTDYFDGGETVTCKVFDDEDQQRVHDGANWVHK